VSTLANMYEQYGWDVTHETCDSFPKSDAVKFALEEKKSELSYALDKAEALLAKTRNTRALVCREVQLRGEVLTCLPDFVSSGKIECI
jgi:hypothetical protein